MTSCKTFQKIRETRKRRIRKNLTPGNNISEQLAVLNGGLFSFCLFIRPAEQIIHGNVQAISQRGDGGVGWHTLACFPKRDRALRDAGKLAELFLG